jgi:hypothetical protein
MLTDHTISVPPGHGVAKVRGRLAARVADHWPLMLAAAVVTIVGLPTVNFAYGPDQALFAYIGDALARGRTLYVDVWDVKPPGVFWVYALATRLPFEPRAIRAFDLAWTLATVAAVYALGRSLWGRAEGAVAGLLYGIAYVTTSGYWNMAQPDSFLVLPLITGVLAWEGGVRGARMHGALLAGVLFGLTFQFRSVVALIPVALVARELWMGGARAAWGRRVVYLAAGFLAFQVLTVLYLVFGGALGEYLYAQFRFARHYASLGGPYAYDRLTLGNYLSGLRGSLMWFAASRLLLVAPALAAIVVGGVLRAGGGVRLCALLLAAAVVGVAVQAKFFVYHWHPVLPFLALLAGWAWAELWRALRLRFKPARATAVIGAMVATLLFFTPQITDPGVREWQDLVRFARDRSYRSLYYDRFGLWGHGTYSFRASEEVANYVAARSQPGETVFVWGYDPNLYLISRRESASRFLSLLPLMTTFTPEKWKREFVAELERKRPAFILIQRGENARWISGRADDSAEWVTEFVPFNEFIIHNYRFDRRIEDYYIYQRR